MKRIKELMLQVVPMEGEDGDLLPSLHTQQDIEKFAELIIRECADVALSEEHDPSDCILVHFGLKR